MSENLPKKTTHDEAPASPARNELGRRLEAVGLKPDIWLLHLRNTLGVEDALLLQYLGNEDYLKLEKYANHSWEKQALKKLLNIEDTKASVKEMLDEKDKKRKDNQAKAKTGLEETKKVTQEVKTRTDKMANPPAETMQKARNTSAERSQSLEKTMEKQHKDLGVTDGELANLGNLSGKDLLYQASGGLALEGVYLTKQLEDVLRKRERLLAAPEGIVITGPVQKPVLKQKEFTSSEAETTFSQSVEKLGFSIATSAKGGFWGFQAEGSYSSSSSSMSEGKKESHMEQTYISTTKYNYIPLASCYISHEQLCLSPAALEELKAVEKILTTCDKMEKHTIAKQRYEKFFSRFGSHANQGPLHFGGIYWWTASSHGFKQELLEEIRQETRTAVNVSAGISYSGLFSTSASIEHSKTHSREAFSKGEKSKMKKMYEMLVTKTGGPVTVDSLDKWKSGLQANSKTWSVIDRGVQLIPVWDIILSHHEEDFGNVYEVAKDLKNIYGSATGLHYSLSFGENVSTALNEANAFLYQMNSWQVEPACQQLNKLNKFRQYLNEKTGNYNIWLNVCLPHPDLKCFLEKVVEFYKERPRSDKSVIRCLLKCLLEHIACSSENIDSYSTVTKWIYQSKKEEPFLKITGFSVFMDLMSQAKNDLLQISPADDVTEDNQEARVKVTVVISSYLQSFLKTLKHMERKEEELLILCAASCVGYSVQNNYFTWCLGWQEVNFLLEKMQYLFQEYKDLKGSKAQAFILFSGLTLGDEIMPRSTEQKKEFLRFMEEKMKSTLESEVHNILNEYSKDGDLRSLIRNLNQVYLGNYEPVNTESLVNEIKSACEVNMEDTVSATAPQPQKNITNKEENLSYSQDIRNLMQSFGLDQYFPKGLTRRNFCVVHKSFQNLLEKETELPLRFMQLLMRLDYRFRYLACKNSDLTYTENVQDTNDDNSVFDTVDDLFEYCAEEETEEFQTDIKGKHPMDLMMAIYHCADDLMRPYIFTKLSMCQFALPLVVPRLYDAMIEIPLWAFRQVQKNILEAGKHKEKPIYQIDFPVVCFSRLGTSPFSKSQLLNNLLSKHRHDIFFHRNCEGSVKNRVLFDGLAEIFWFCPSGKDTDQFENCTAFVNLRGDARKYSKQAAFLQEISTVNVVMFSKSDHKESGNEMSSKKLKEKPLIILSPDREASRNVNTESKQVIIGLKNQNEAKVLEELNTTLRRLLATSSKLTNLEHCAEMGRQHGFLVDEDGKECGEGKMHAQKIMSVLKQKDLKAKEELLPLSGQLWHSWCKKDKELTRLQNKMNRSIEQHCSEIETFKTSIRKEQLEKASHNQFIKAIITQLKSLSKTTKLFFLQWLKLYIDSLSYDRVMDLRDEYNRLWGLLNSEEMKEKDVIETIQISLENTSDQMNACMFGLEHVLREVGQTYEALCDLQYKDDCFYELPKIAADMMISGYPIELMDGDACYVPLKWIKAVLGELSKSIGDKNIFVLSVLGVQSSGKSTLLNTMFGLQFAVSAGRCTRGAFMQLVEITDELKKDLDFDYILVIDTEGLRAMELSNKATLNHDNELATFVIGVGNMTLINVFGENPSEIKDVLQIAVQAFLRMKQVKLSSSCLFVHQNVGDLTAKDKNMEGRRNLQIELDNMTALAAEQEQCNVQHFSEVISFDANRHIRYFAHLWEGNPPMAPPNPHYSEDAQKVKDIILQCMANERHNILNISKLTVRIEDLWSALRNENFVFSFKNTLEISAYSKVENKYKKLTWQLRRRFLELQTKLNNKIKKGEIGSFSQNDVEEEVKETYDSIKEEFKCFFSEEKDREILIQWKASIENRVKSLHTELVEETRRQAMELIRLKKSQSQVEKRQMGYEEELFRKSKQLALDLKNEGLKESELRDHFNILWQEWVAEINATVPHTEHPNIISEAEDVLLQNFKHERSMNDKLNNFSTWMSFSIDLSKHAIGKKGWLKSYKPNEADMKWIMQQFNHLVKIVQEYLKKKRNERVDYNQTFFYEIIIQVSETISNINSSDVSKKFTLTELFKYDVTLYLFGLAVPFFDSMHKAFQAANNPVATLASKRGDFFNCFTISCQGAASIKTFSNFLCLKILESIRPALYDKTALAIVDEMTANYPAFSGNRSKLENYILIDLAEQEDFEQYREYIHFPKIFFKGFVEKCVNGYCLGKNSQKLKHFLQISFDYFNKQVLRSISDSTRFVKNRNGDISEWLDDFYEIIEDFVTFSRADLKSIEHQEMQDIEFIQEAMCTTWDIAAANFQKNFETTNFEDFEKKPHEILIEQLCGCWEQCPFCRAICTNTIPGHDGDHSVPFHRSQAINGMPWINSDEFVTEICSTLISSDSCLVIDRATQFLYKDYRKIGPNYANWSITPDTSSQPYWKWYVCHFRTKLEDDYCLKFQGRGEIPAQWETVTKREVIATLREQL
ncbi:interferon-induced very large GTPase 1-like [Hyperolius riggenbachi]|uniref:interferon-induced very large GTPase 1-like n=1 Tax=Hyperolius riggenbachi TaxID=752182 RepID=UPI0035A3A1F9